MDLDKLDYWPLGEVMGGWKGFGFNPSQILVRDGDILEGEK